MRWAGDAARAEGKKNVYRIWKKILRGPFGIARCRWEVGIKRGLGGKNRLRKV
jgi:hypothetical protein